jgi:cytochrome bd-type quinol oxidase subunit 2
MPAPRRARTRLACGLAATAVAAALALAPLTRVEGPRREALAWLAGAALLLAAGAALRAPSLLAPALLALLAEYTIVLLQGGDRVDAAAPLVAAGLLLYAELASWAREASPRVRDERPVLTTRAAVVAASTLAAVVVGALVLLAAALPAGGGLARLAVGVVATTATLALVAVVARPTATRVPRG